MYLLIFYGPSLSSLLKTKHTEHNNRTHPFKQDHYWLYLYYICAAVLQMSVSLVNDHLALRSGQYCAHSEKLWQWHCGLVMSHESHRISHLQAVYNGGVEVWKGSDTETCLLPRCSDPTQGGFSPVILTPAQLQR